MGNDRSERCETCGAFRTYQFTLGTSLAVLTPIEQSEKKRLPSFRVQREKRNVSNQYYEEFTTSSIRDAVTVSLNTDRERNTCNEMEWISYLYT